MNSANRDDDGSISGPKAIRIVRCPNCGGESIYAESNLARPFCSARCKNMDFGAWASESFRVPEPFAADDRDELASTLQ